MDVLQGTEVVPHNEYTTKSRNYKLGVAHDNMEASIQGSVIFDPSSQLPKEVLLETTLKAFGYSMDIWEVGNPRDHNYQPFVIQKETILFFVSTLISMCCVYCQFATGVRVNRLFHNISKCLECLFPTAWCARKGL